MKVTMFGGPQDGRVVEQVVPAEQIHFPVLLDEVVHLESEDRWMTVTRPAVGVYLRCDTDPNDTHYYWDGYA